MPILVQKRSTSIKVIFALFAVLLGPVISRADDIYTVSSSATTFSFTEPTILTSGDTTAITQISGATVAEFSWNSSDAASCGGTDGLANVCIFYGPDSYVFDGFTAGSFEALGVYTSIDGNTTVTIEAGPAVPEPSSLILLGSGAFALLGARRRRLG